MTCSCTALECFWSPHGVKNLPLNIIEGEERRIACTDKSVCILCQKKTEKYFPILKHVLYEKLSGRT